MKKRILCSLLFIFIVSGIPLSFANDANNDVAKQDHITDIAFQSSQIGKEALHFDANAFWGTFLILRDVVVSQGLPISQESQSLLMTKEITSSSNDICQSSLLKNIVLSHTGDLSIRLVALELLLHMGTGSSGETMAEILAHPMVPPLFKSKILNMIKNDPPQIFNQILYYIIHRARSFSSPHSVDTTAPIATADTAALLPLDLSIETITLAMEALSNVKGRHITPDCLLTLSQLMQSTTSPEEIRVQALLTYAERARDLSLAIQEIGALTLADNPSKTMRIHAFQFLLSHRSHESTRPFIEQARERMRLGTYIGDYETELRLLEDSGKLRLPRPHSLRETTRRLRQSVQDIAPSEEDFFSDPARSSPQAQEGNFAIEFLYRMRSASTGPWSLDDISRTLRETRDHLYPNALQQQPAILDRWLVEVQNQGIMSDLIRLGGLSETTSYRDIASALKKALHLLPSRYLR